MAVDIKTARGLTADEISEVTKTIPVRERAGVYVFRFNDGRFRLTWPQDRVTAAEDPDQPPFTQISRSRTKQSIAEAAFIVGNDSLTVVYPTYEPISSRSELRGVLLHEGLAQPFAGSPRTLRSDISVALLSVAARVPK